MAVFQYDRMASSSVHVGELSLSVIPTDDVTIGRSDGSTPQHYHCPGIFGDGPEYDGAITADQRLLLLAETGDRAFRLNPARRSVESIRLRRLEKDDPDYFRQSIIEVSGKFLLVYESGLVMLSGQLEVEWQVPHGRLDWFFKGVFGGRAVVESEHEGVWSYDLRTGQKSTGPRRA